MWYDLHNQTKTRLFIRYEKEDIYLNVVTANDITYIFVNQNTKKPLTSEKNKIK